MDIAEKVLEIMRAEGQPLNAGKIVELGGLDRKDVDKAMTKLKKRKRLSHQSGVIGHRCPCTQTRPDYIRAYETVSGNSVR